MFGRKIGFFDGGSCSLGSNDSTAEVKQKATGDFGWWLCYFVIYLLVYFPLFQRGGMHWDEVLDAGGAANGTYIAAGRWGLALYRWLFEVGYVPWTSGIIAGVYIATALVVQYKLFGIFSRSGRFLYGAVYIGCIQWASQLQYSHQSDAVALALLCVTAVAYLLTLKCWRSGVLAVGLTVYACSVYQTAMLYLLVVWMLRLMTEQTPVLTEWRSHVRSLLLVFVAGVLYLVSRAVSKSLPMVSETDICCVRMVQTYMSKWDEIMAAPSLGDKVDLWIFYTVCYTKVIIKNLLGLKYEGQWVYATAMWPVLGLLRRYLCGKRDVIRAMLLLLVWTVPFVMSLIVMTDQGARVSLAEPLSVAGIWALYLKNLKNWNNSVLWRWTMVVLGGWVVLKSGYRCAVIAEDEKNIYLSKMENLGSLNARILAVAESANMSSPSVIYFGDLPTKTWNPYIKRWGHYRECESIIRLPNGRFPGGGMLQCGNTMRKCSADEASLYGKIVKDMPTWPAPGSVAGCGNAVLVRFADAVSE